MKDRFDLENEIYDCWRVIDDIKVLTDKLQDENPPTKSEIVSFLSGLTTMYNFKYEKLFDTFQQVLKLDNYQDNYQSSIQNFEKILKEHKLKF